MRNRPQPAITYAEPLPPGAGRHRSRKNSSCLVSALPQWKRRQEARSCACWAAWLQKTPESTASPPVRKGLSGRLTTIRSESSSRKTKSWRPLMGETFVRSFWVLGRDRRLPAEPERMGIGLFLFRAQCPSKGLAAFRAILIACAISGMSDAQIKEMAESRQLPQTH